MPLTVSAKEMSKDSEPVLRQAEEETVEACADIKKAKEACLAEVSRIWLTI